MSDWLLKTDPETYALGDLEREKKTVWEGVRNNQALIHLRAMTHGDRALIYHSGDDKAVMGIVEIVSGAYPDPKADDPKLVVVDVAFKERMARPVTLAQIKADADFKQFDLVRNSRLSVMPVPAGLWKKIMAMSKRSQ
ncbi:MAG: EVE domain-containing protein [Planctomycetes bacterium]|nr:EVE domain-containing protein [Planctomycetota bacterium]